MDYLRKLHVAYRPTLGSYQQHDFSRLSSEKLIFLAKAFAQLEVPHLADNVYTKYLISQYSCIHEIFNIPTVTTTEQSRMTDGDTT